MMILAQANAAYIPLAGESVHMVVCSPPYFGARKYAGAQDRIWGGDPTCEHIWEERVSPGMTGGHGEKSPAQSSGDACVLKMFSSSQHAFCQKCGAWRGALGLEPHVDMFVANLVEIFRDVKRVLRKDGVAFIVIGDSYVGSGGGSGRNSKIQSNNVGSLEWRDECRRERVPSSISSPQPNGLKPGDLFGVPWRLGMALQRNGWWLRSAIIWAKSVSFCPTYVGSCMPESVKDRPTRSHEYVLLLSKSRHYYYDFEAVAEPLAQSTLRDRRTLGGRHGVKSGKYVERKDHGHHVDDLRYGKIGPTDVMKGRNLRSVWLLGSSRGFSGAHYACVDEETEALTPRGWKRQSELADGDLIAGYEVGIDRWYWQKATFHRYDYDGKMIQIEKREASQLLTPRHRCPMRRRMGHGGCDGWKFDVVMAHQLQPAYELLLSAPYRDTSLEKLGTTLAALLGWFVTDGSMTKSGAVIFYQSLSANGWKCDQIRRLLDDYGAEYSENTRHREWNGQPIVMLNWYITGKLASRLTELAPDRELTPEMTELSGREMRALFEAIVDGDGCRRKDGRLHITQKSKKHIDAMQILATRLGYKTVLSRRKGQDVHQLYITDKKWVTLRGTNGTHNSLPMTNYKGVVWCPSVDTGFWIARRNGKVFITGNSFPCELVEPCIKAGTSEYGVCGECGSPYRRAGDDWQPTCECDCSVVKPATVLDPFAGTCTTGVVCKKLGRDFVGLDLSHSYLSEFGRERLGMKILEEWEARSGEGKSLRDLPMFANLGGEL